MPTTPLDPWLLCQRLEVGDRLRTLRHWRNLRQPGLGERAGLSRDTVYRIETGVRAMDSDQAHLLARALGVPPAWLYSDDWSGPLPRSGWPDNPPPPRPRPRASRSCRDGR